MQRILEHNIATADLKRFEEEYHCQLAEAREVSPQLQFEYAWCLVQSCYQGDVRKGVLLLEQLLASSQQVDICKRDYYFYLAFGYTRLKEHNPALKHIRKLRSLEPDNQQALQLEQLIASRRRKERAAGVLVAGGAALALGGVAAILGSSLAGGFSLARVGTVLLALARR